MVHRSKIGAHIGKIILQELRDQIGKYLYPVHRLDSKTTGVLIFALDRDTAVFFGKLFGQGQIKKRYHAIVRGWMQNNGVVDYSLTNDRGKKQNAITKYAVISKAEIALSDGRFETSRYSLIECNPLTGRMHQIRKHMNHLRHPILGDRPHGCNKQNRLWKKEFDLTDMMLHAKSLTFEHPVSHEFIQIHAAYPKEFVRVLNILGIPKPKCSSQYITG